MMAFECILKSEIKGQEWDVNKKGYVPKPSFDVRLRVKDAGSDHGTIELRNITPAEADKYEVGQLYNLNLAKVAPAKTNAA